MHKAWTGQVVDGVYILIVVAMDTWSFETMSIATGWFFALLYFILTAWVVFFRIRMHRGEVKVTNKHTSHCMAPRSIQL